MVPSNDDDILDEVVPDTAAERSQAEGKPHRRASARRRMTSKLSGPAQIENRVGTDASFVLPASASSA